MRDRHTGDGGWGGGERGAEEGTGRARRGEERSYRGVRERARREGRTSATRDRARALVEISRDEGDDGEDSTTTGRTLSSRRSLRDLRPSIWLCTESTTSSAVCLISSTACSNFCTFFLCSSSMNLMVSSASFCVFFMRFPNQPVSWSPPGGGSRDPAARSGESGVGPASSGFAMAPARYARTDASPRERGVWRARRANGNNPRGGEVTQRSALNTQQAAVYRLNCSIQALCEQCPFLANSNFFRIKTTD